MIQTASEVFDTVLPKALTDHADKSKAIGATFNFHVADAGDWAVDTKAAPATVKKGTIDKPDCTARISAADLLALAQDHSLALKFYVSGKLKVEGDAMKLQKVVGLLADYVKV